nr:ATP-binding protein [Streptomyces spinosus]
MCPGLVLVHAEAAEEGGEQVCPFGDDIAHATSARRARRLVTAQLADWSVGALADVAELLVSELVTNALRYSRGSLRLNLRLREGRLLCEVEDTTSAGPVRVAAAPDAEGGRGTELIDMLADAWGSTRTATGKTVWFELRSGGRGQEAPGPGERGRVRVT